MCNLAQTVCANAARDSVASIRAVELLATAQTINSTWYKHVAATCPDKPPLYVRGYHASGRWRILEITRKAPLDRLGSQKHLKAYQNASKHLKTSQNLLKPLQTLGLAMVADISENLSKPFKTS